MELKFHKVTSLPGTLDAHALYFVENGGYAETYVTNAAAAAKSVGNSSMINALIAEQLSGLNKALIVADIAARDALSLSANTLVYVLNATGDASVSSGAAQYLYNQSNGTYTKISEFESMDVVVTWTSISGRPTSTPGSIDLAVTNSHTHSNKAALDLLTAPSGVLLYNGEPVKNWNTTNW